MLKLLEAVSRQSKKSNFSGTCMNLHFTRLMIANCNEKAERFSYCSLHHRSIKRYHKNEFNMLLCALVFTINFVVKLIAKNVLAVLLPKWNTFIQFTCARKKENRAFGKGMENLSSCSFSSFLL